MQTPKRAKKEQSSLFTFFLHHLPPAEDPILQFLLQNRSPVKKPRSFSGIEAETTFAKPLICEKVQ